ncbi:MAG: hypothetical protein WCP38_05255, partial [Chloroflexota bacterium]
MRRAKSSQYAQNAPSSIKKQIISRFPQHEKARVSTDFETFHGKNGRLLLSNLFLHYVFDVWMGKH